MELTFSAVVRVAHGLGHDQRVADAAAVALQPQLDEGVVQQHFQRVKIADYISVENALCLATRSRVNVHVVAAKSVFPASLAVEVARDLWWAEEAGGGVVCEAGARLPGA